MGCSVWAYVGPELDRFVPCYRLTSLFHIFIQIFFNRVFKSHTQRSRIRIDKKCKIIISYLSYYDIQYYLLILLIKLSNYKPRRGAKLLWAEPALTSYCSRHSRFLLSVVHLTHSEVVDGHVSLCGLGDLRPAAVLGVLLPGLAALGVLVLLAVVMTSRSKWTKVWLQIRSLTPILSGESVVKVNGGLPCHDFWAQMNKVLT